MRSALAAHVEFLCQPDLAGRRVGSRGERRARDYLVSELVAAGFAPGVGHLDPFEVTIPDLKGAPRLSVDGIELEDLLDFCVNVQGAAGAGEASSRAIWVSDGLPEASVRSHVVVYPPLRGAHPLDQYLERVRAARDHGAVAMLQESPEPRRRKVMRHRGEGRVSRRSTSPRR